jgi:pimeloyl-ACP methyl ester carboxylesterase
MKRLLAFLAALLMTAVTYADSMQPAKIGIVIMHGKGGSPTKNVSDLASALEAKGYLVANLDMPWSGRRDYDASVDAADNEVEAALAILRNKGATKVFVAGHSQGGLFALHFANAHVIDGLIAIAPGGNVDSAVFREKVGASVEQARKLIADGKGNGKTGFMDFEGAKGTTPVHSTAAIYLSWFDPDGAMNQSMAVKNMSPTIPVLYIAPKNDYPGLFKANPAMFAALPANPLTRLYEPNTNHLGAPSGSLDEIVKWTADVANAAR